MSTPMQGDAQASPGATAFPRLGLVPLSGIVIGSMIGSGAYSLPQNMAAGAGPAAVIIGWLITAAWVLVLPLVYLTGGP